MTLDSSALSLEDSEEKLSARRNLKLVRGPGVWTCLEALFLSIEAIGRLYGVNKTCTFWVKLAHGTTFDAKLDEHWAQSYKIDCKTDPSYNNTVITTRYLHLQV